MSGISSTSVYLTLHAWGVFEPGELRSNISCFLSFPLQVIEEAKLTQYHDALQRWEEEKKRQQEEFTITDKNLTEGQVLQIDPSI